MITESEPPRGRLARPRPSRAETGLVALIIAVAGYLSLVNLGGAPLWHDEAATGLQARYLIANGGSAHVWDGRNMFLEHGSSSTNAELRNVVTPRLPAWTSAIGMLAFGDDEFGVRAVHTLLGLLSLPLLWLALRIDFPRRARFRILAVLLFALGTSTLLFMRLGRYIPDSFFYAMLLYLAYRLYLRSGGRGWLALMSAAATLGLLNNYYTGAAFPAALAISHLLWHRSGTSRRQWIELVVAGLVPAAACAAFLHAIGFFDHIALSGSLYASREQGWLESRPEQLWIHFRDLVGFALVPAWIAAALAALAAANLASRFLAGRGAAMGRIADRLGRAPQGMPDIRYHLAFVLIYAALIGMAAYSTLGIEDGPYASVRYFGAIMPFLALLSAAVVEWLWRRSAYAALALAALLLLTTIPTLPRHGNLLSRQSEPWLTLPNAMKEFRSARRNATAEMIEFLSENANQDDWVYVHRWHDRSLYQFYLADRLIFCCSLGSDQLLNNDEVRRLAPHELAKANRARWILLSEKAEFDDTYEKAFVSESYAFPDHRPEPGLHVFRTLREADGYQPAYILRNKRY